MGSSLSKLKNFGDFKDMRTMISKEKKKSLLSNPMNTVNITAGKFN